MAPPQPGNARRRAPYNAFVQHEREQKYYHRKRALNKYKRLQKYEGKQQSDDTAVAKGSFGDQVIAVGADALTDDYERRLALSFGGDTLASDAQPATKKRKKKRRSDDLAAVVPSVEASNAGARDALSAKRKRTETPVVETYGAVSDSRDGDGSARSRKKKRVSAAEHGASPSEKGANVNATPKAAAKDTISGAPKAPRDGKAIDSYGRYSKDLWKYQQAEAAKDAERWRKNSEICALQQRRRNSAKGRAVKGQHLSQRTHRGQPHMSTILEMVTAKLAQEGKRPGRV